MKTTLWKLANKPVKPMTMVDLIEPDRILAASIYLESGNRIQQLIAEMTESGEVAAKYAATGNHRSQILAHNVRMQEMCRQVRVLISGAVCKKCKRIMADEGHPICGDCYIEWLSNRQPRPEQDEYDHNYDYEGVAFGVDE
jgi:hypothetical protein